MILNVFIKYENSTKNASGTLLYVCALLKTCFSLRYGKVDLLVKNILASPCTYSKRFKLNNLPVANVHEHTPVTKSSTYF